MDQVVVEWLYVSPESYLCFLRIASLVEAFPINPYKHVYRR